MMKILIIDDHEIVRQGLKRILVENPRISVTGEASNGADALEMIDRERYDVVVLDISLPGRNGLDVLKDIKTAHPSLPVLILSMYPEEQYAVRALKDGASGYVTKDTVHNDLIEAIAVVSAGRNYITPSLAEKLSHEIKPNADRPSHENLSDREFQVLCLIARGNTVKSIAEKLHLSVKTISTYRTRILEKMGLKTNAALTQYAFRHGLVD